MTPHTLADAVEFYDARAAEFAARYDSVRFEDVHAPARRHLPTPPASVLDVGAGSGRDALALARRGHPVVAVEPAAGLREHGARATAGEDVRWLDDRLPDLPRVRALGTTFDLILASAVLMHLDGDDLGRAMATFAVLASADGRVVASLRGRAPGEPAALFHDHSDAAVLGAAEEAGLSLVDRWTAADALGRDRTWRGFVLAQR